MGIVAPQSTMVASWQESVSALYLGQKSTFSNPLKTKMYCVLQQGVIVTFLGRINEIFEITDSCCPINLLMQLVTNPIQDCHVALSHRC